MSNLPFSLLAEVDSEFVNDVKDLIDAGYCVLINSDMGFMWFILLKHRSNGNVVSFRHYGDKWEMRKNHLIMKTKHLGHNPRS